MSHYNCNNKTHLGGTCCDCDRKKDCKWEQIMPKSDPDLNKIQEILKDIAWGKTQMIRLQLVREAAQALEQLLLKERNSGGQGFAPHPKTDEHGNPIIWLNRYEAEAVCHLIKNSDPQRFDTGDWFRDVPFKIEQFLRGADISAQTEVSVEELCDCGKPLHYGKC